MKLLNHLAGLLAVFRGFAIPLRALLQNAGTSSIPNPFSFLPLRSRKSAPALALCVLLPLISPQALWALQTAEDVLTLEVTATEYGTDAPIHWKGPLVPGGGTNVSAGVWHVSSMEISGGAKNKTYPLIETHWKTLEVSATDTNGDNVPDTWARDEVKGVGGNYLGSDPWGTQWAHWDLYLGTRGVQFRGGQKLHYDLKLIRTVSFDCEGGIYFEKGCAAAPANDCGGSGSCSSGTCSGTGMRPGSGAGRVCSVHIPIDLGRSLLDGTQAEINLEVPDDARGFAICNPAFLDLRGLADWTSATGHGVIYETDPAGVLQPRQIRTTTSFVDIQRFGVSGAVAEGYYLRFFHLGDIGSHNGSLYTIPTASEPYTVWRFYFPDPDTVQAVKNYTGIGGAEVTYTYTYALPVSVSGGNREGGWTLSVSSGSQLLKTEASIDIIDATNSVIGRRRIVRDQDNVIVSKVGTELDADGHILTESTYAADDTIYRSRHYTYGSFNGHTHVVKNQDWDGRWSYYNDYDSEGRPRCWVEQLANNPYTGTWPDNTNRSFERTEGSDCEMLTERKAGVVVARSWKKAEGWGENYADENNLRRITESTATDFTKGDLSDWADSSNLKTVIYLYDRTDQATGAYKNSRWLEIAPGGTATLTKYFTGSTVINGITVPTDITETYRGLPSSLTPTAYEVVITAGTKTVEETTLAGEMIYRRVSDISSSVILEERQAVDFDAFGRVTEYKLFNNNALTEKRSYACCGLEWETDAYGVKTEYTYDALGRVKTRTDYANGTGDQPPVRREFVYDALNRKTKTLVGPISPTNSQLTEEERNYNLAGELTWTKDGLARQTIHSESVSGGYVVHTTTAPDGSTRVEKLYQDGSLYEKASTVSPTATRGVRYSYATDSSGNRSVTETPLDNGTLVSTAAITRWTDFAGRPWKTVSPDPDESGTIEEVRHYATPTQTAYKPGQLYKLTRTGRPDTLFTYDSLGRLSAQGEDINADGTLTASGGTDRLREFIYTYAGRGELGPYTLTTRIWNASGTYLTEAQGKGFSPYAFSASVSKPGQDTLIVGQSITASTATLVRTEIQGALQIVTTTKYGRLASVVKKDFPGGSQLSAVTYAYDAYGRLATQTDARNGATTYTYDNAGRIATVTTPDPDTTANDAGRRPQTLTYIRTDLGSSAGYGWRETVSRRHSGATGTIVEETVSEYYPTGELRLSYGANTSSGSYAYDFAGRLKTLTTWRDFNLSTGAGTGTGDTTTWTYNDAGLLKTKRYPDNKGPDYTYDSAGRLTTREWARTVSSVRLKATYAYSSTTGDLTGIDYSDNTWTTDVTYSGHDRLGRPGSVTDGSGTRTLSYTTVYPLAEEYTAGALDNHKVTATRTTGGRLDYLLTERDSLSDYQVFYTWGTGNRLDNVFWWQQFDDPADGEFFREFAATYTYATNSDLVSGISASFFDSLLYEQNQPYSTTPLTQTRVHDYLNRVTSITATTDDGVNSPVTRSLAYAHNDRNQRTQVTNQSGSYWNYGYDSDSAARGVGQVSSAVRKVSGGTTAPGFEFGYAYDAMGNRTGATANGQPSTYYQGTGGSGSSGGNAVNQYGSRGVPRVLDIAGLADSSATVTVNSQSTQRQGEHWFKQLALSGNAAQWQSVAVSISTGGSTSGSVLLKEHPEVYAYDDDGNLTSDGRWTYVWDAENRLKRMETASSAYTAGAPRKRIDYAYDDRGRRTLKSVYTWNTSISAFNTTPAAKVGFLYHDWNLLQEVDLSGSSPATLRSYYWGLDLSGSLQGAGGVGGLLAADLDAATYSTAFYASDANGNVSDLALCQGGFATHYEYDAFGNAYPENTGWINLASLNPFRFSTKYTETDAATGGNETGLLYYGFRYYNPSTGRWPNRDPIEENGGLNLYGMIGNDALSRIDALGLAPPSKASASIYRAKRDCSWTLYVAHGRENWPKFKSQGPPSCGDRTGWVGCGMNNLNDRQGDETGIPLPRNPGPLPDVPGGPNGEAVRNPDNDPNAYNPMEPSDSRRPEDWDGVIDLYSMDQLPSLMEQAWASALQGVKAECANAKSCCKSVTVSIKCGKGINNAMCGRTETVQCH